MTNGVNTREIILDILLELRKDGAKSHVVINNALTKYQYLDKRDRSFISRIVQGTIEKKIEIDYIIDKFSKTPVKKMKPLIRCLLEMSVYQLKYMDSIPVSAVCNEAVKLAVKRKFSNLRGFVNGVLRNISRNLQDIEYPDKEKDFLQYISIKESMPLWLVKLWRDQLGEEKLQQILEGISREKKTYIRCNTKKVSPKELRLNLENEGITVKAVPGIDFAFEISDYDYLGGLKSFENGEFQVQDLSSMLAGIAAKPKEALNIIDVCAAPGGKSINVALLTDKGSVDARDISEQKVSLIENNLLRLSIENVTLQVWDATITDQSSIGKADIVIADLPCSGLGIIGRKPDIKYNMNPDKLKELVNLQRRILSVISEYVKPGGSLIYSTCTVNRAENEENVEWFCKSFPFKVQDLSRELSAYTHNSDTTFGVQLLPGQYDTDGFFISRLKRYGE